MQDFWSAFFDPQNALGHIAYILIITSMMMRSMRWLRALAIASGITAAGFYIHIGDMISCFWELLFTLVNIVQLSILAYENRKRQFSDDERLFIETCLPNVERAQLVRVLKLGAWTQVQENMPLTQQGVIPQNLKFIVDGTCDIMCDDKVIAHAKPGDFLAEMSYLTGKSATATALTRSPVRYLAINRERLHAHLKNHPEVRHALEASFNRNLIDKLAKTNDRALANQDSQN